LNAIPAAQLANDDFLIIAGTNCIGCVQYLLKSNVFNNLIVVTENMSLSEVNILVNNYHVSEYSIYFVPKSKTHLKEINYGPKVLLKNQCLIDYDKLSALSKNFTLSIRKFTKLVEQECQ